MFFVPEKPWQGALGRPLLTLTGQFTQPIGADVSPAPKSDGVKPRNSDA
jgi:hypothetical protein